MGGVCSYIGHEERNTSAQTNKVALNKCIGLHLPQQLLKVGSGELVENALVGPLLLLLIRVLQLRLASDVAVAGVMHHTPHPPLSSTMPCGLFRTPQEETQGRKMNTKSSTTP
jgi:hypothetical protein